MYKYKIVLEYDGAGYRGWQTQKNAKSIQETVVVAAQKFLGEPVDIQGAGRTDAGVHACAQVVNFKTKSRIPLGSLWFALNDRLPKDITVSSVKKVRADFHSRFDAKSKIYRYTIVNNDIVNPLLRRYAVKCFYKIDIDLMKKAAKLLIGRHDFTSFLE